MELNLNWEFVADTVMGGVSDGGIVVETFQDRPAVVLRGGVSTENNGGFIQIASDFHPDGEAFDASAWDGIEIDVWGNNESYDIRLRTDQLERPWQSFRSGFETTRTWQTLRFPFDDFEPHKTDSKLKSGRLRRIGILAVGREFTAEVAVSAVRLF